MRNHFRAPWSVKVKLVTGGVLLLLVTVCLTTDSWWVQGTLLAVVLGALVFGVRGYTVTDGQLLVQRLGWAKAFDLDRLVEARVEPGATMGAMRTLASGGLFGFVGRFRNAHLGSYRGYATDGEKAVVLRFEDDGTVVITPEAPADFVALLWERSG